METLRKYSTIAFVSLSNAVAYRVSVYARFCFYTLMIYVFMSLWRTIYTDGSIAGYTFTQMVWYLIMTEFVTFASGTSIVVTISDEVKTGSLAYHLSRPTHYVFYHLASTVGQVLVNAFGFGVLAVVLGFVFVGPLTTFAWAGLVPLLLSVSMGLLLHFFILILIGLSAFVLEDNYGLYLIYQKSTFMLGMLLPIEFLPPWLQAIARRLPFPYVCWAPAKIFVDYSPTVGLELLSHQSLWLCATVVLTLLAYRLCVRRLQINGG